MVLKDTKVTAAPSTVLPSKNLVRSHCTAKAFRASKDGSRQGLACERQVLRWFEAQGYRLLQQRRKTPFGEIDLWLLGPDHKPCAVEVKSTPDFQFLETRISRKQRDRLRRTWRYLIDRHPGVPYLVAFQGSAGSPLILSLSDV